MTSQPKHGQPTCADVNATSRGPPTAPRVAESGSATERATCMPAAGATRSKPDVGGPLGEIANAALGGIVTTHDKAMGCPVIYTRWAQKALLYSWGFLAHTASLVQQQSYCCLQRRRATGHRLHEQAHCTRPGCRPSLDSPLGTTPHTTEGAFALVFFLVLAL